MNKLFVTSFKIIAMVIFIAIVPILFYSQHGTTLVWTILIPIIPIVLLSIGFSRWRDICPLAIISKITQNRQIIQKRKVPLWFEKNFWYFQYFLLFSALTLRLITLNYNSLYLGIFFIVVILSALLVNLFFTGKSWCNFFCPVGVVEKIYAISNAKNYTHNSACATCTACKKNCPDIDLESNYWKEGHDEQKSFVFYSFGGMVLGFYLYFYLQSGSFSYYFSGEWAHDKIGLFSDGLFFAPFVPVIVAAPLTLALFSLLSYSLFKSLENYLIEKNIFQNENYETVTHGVKVLASFIAFNIFYIFAGAPTYQEYPIAYSIFYFIVVALSSIIFYKEIFRKEDYFIQERFALKILKQWNSTKPLPSNLKEIYYTYMNENKSKKERLDMYKSSITELMQEGILNERSMKILEKLRDQIGISYRDHERIISQIKSKHSNLFDANIEHSAEREYQENSYKRVIENALKEHVEIDASHLKSLQKQFCISDRVHHKIMESIINTNDKIHQDILDLLMLMHELLIIKNSIYEDKTREVYFLKYSIKNEFTFASKDLFSILFTIYKEHKDTIKILLRISKGKSIDKNFTLNRETLHFFDDKIIEKMLLIHQDFMQTKKSLKMNNNKRIIKRLLSHESLQIAIAALLNTKQNTKEFLSQDILDRFCNSQDNEILELLYKLVYKTNRITTYERMMYLNFIPLFRNLKFDDLHMLGQSTKVETYMPGDYIIKQGDEGNTLYILIRGEALVEIENRDVATLGHREYFGEIALLGDTKRTASVKVTLPTTALTITKRDFKLFLQHNPKVSTKVIKEIIKKLV